jgi:hypothetical protein
MVFDATPRFLTGRLHPAVPQAGALGMAADLEVSAGDSGAA